MASYLDEVPLSGIIRIRDMMYSVADPFRLDQGDVSFDSPDTVKSAMVRAIAENKTHYVLTAGLPRLRELIAAKLRDQNRVPVENPEDVLVTNGGIHGLHIICQALLEPGDEVLVPDPEWPPTAGHVRLAHGVPVPCPLHESRGWRYDLDELEAKITPETRVLYLNSPNNPTGGLLTRTDLERLAAIATEHDLWVISDEAYDPLVYDGAQHVSIASLPGMAERTLSVFTFSKSYAMTGWRVGYVVSPPAMRNVMGPLLAFYTTHGVFPSAQIAALAAVTGPQDCVATMRDAYHQRRRLLLDGLAAGSAVWAPEPKGAFYAFANVAVARGERDLWALADEWLGFGVAALPGTAFGPEFGDWVRLSLATRADDVAEAARRIAQHAGAGARA